MSQPQADRFAADGKSGLGSETGSTVMTNDLPARVAHQFGCHELQSGQVEA
jgi:hypothetical protein